MAVKCAPILSPVQEILADYFYGVGCASGDEDPKNRFIQHYLLNLDCPSSEEVICLPTVECDCNNGEAIILCAGVIHAITQYHDQQDNLSEFGFSSNITDDIHGYKWYFDTTLLEVVSGTDDVSKTLQLRWKTGVPQQAVTDITLEISYGDNGCIMSKTCCYKVEATVCTPYSYLVTGSDAPNDPIVITVINFVPGEVYDISIDGGVTWPHTNLNLATFSITVSNNSLSRKIIIRKKCGGEYAYSFMTDWAPLIN